MILNTDDMELSFCECPITITERNIANVFSRKNNKSLYDTVSNIKVDNKYKKFKRVIDLKYEIYKDYPLGVFLFHLKSCNNPFYKEFLNRYGDGEFCTFALADGTVFNLKGLYCYYVDSKLMYIGRCRDSFGKRVNHGYGKIHPKNCYIDGQQTNCHLNSLINSVSGQVSLYICPLTNENQIIKLERGLIGKHNPLWNIALRTKNNPPIINYS